MWQPHWPPQTVAARNAPEASMECLQLDVVSENRFRLYILATDSRDARQ